MDSGQENLEFLVQRSFYNQNQLDQPINQFPEDIRQIVWKFVANGIQKQKEYIAYLKVVNLCIFLQLGGNQEEKQLVQSAISNLETIIKLHETFFYDLTQFQQVEQNNSVQDIFSRLRQLFQKNINFLQHYFLYFTHLSSLQQLIQRAKLREIDNIREILEKTQQRFNQYENSLKFFVSKTENSGWKELLVNFQNIRIKINNALEAQDQIMIQSKIYGELKLIKNYQVEYRKKQCELYFAVSNKQKKYLILIIWNQNKNKKILKQAYTITRWLKNAIFRATVFQNSLVFLSDGNKSMVLKFQSQKQAFSFSSKLAQIQKLIKKDQIAQQEDMAMPCTFNIQFVGLKQRPFEQQTYCFKFINEEINISQQIFIRQSLIDQLQQHYKKNKEVKLEDCKAQYNFKAQQQAQMINAWYFLNKLFSNRKVLKKRNYLFYKLNIFDGLVQQRKLEAQCLTCNSINSIQSIESIKQILLQYENDWNSSICCLCWVSAQKLLAKKLNEKYRTLIFPEQSSQNEKQRLLLAFLEQNSANWKLNKMYCRQVTQKQIVVKYFQFEQIKTLYIEIQFQEETIQTLLNKVCERLKLQNNGDFGIYRQYQNKNYFYQNHEFLSIIHSKYSIQPRSSLFFGKKLFFSPKTQVLLLPPSMQKRKQRIIILLGSILRKLKKLQFSAHSDSATLFSFFQRFYNLPKERIKNIFSSHISDLSFDFDNNAQQLPWSFQQHYQNVLISLYKHSKVASQQYDCLIVGEQRKKAKLQISYKNLSIKKEKKRETFDYCQHKTYSSANQISIGKETIIEVAEANFIHKKILILKKMYQKQEKLKFSNKSKSQISGKQSSVSVQSFFKQKNKAKKNLGLFNRNTVIIDDFYSQIQD